VPSLLVRLLCGLICSNTSLTSGVDGYMPVWELFWHTSNICVYSKNSHLCVDVNVIWQLSDVTKIGVLRGNLVTLYCMP